MRLGTERDIRILEIALAALLVLALARIVWTFAIPQKPVIPPTVQMPDVGVVVNKREIDTSILSSFDPFHRERPTTVAGMSAAVLEDAPETQLDLKVYGMRAHIGGDTSSAIIQTPDNKQAAYFIGDEIIPGVTLKSVDIDFVILDRNGVSERLSRQGKKEDGRETGPTRELDNLAFEASDMLNDLRFYPHREGRNVIGYKMRSRRGGAIAKYGFERDDIITSINGEDLTQPQVNLPSLWKNFKMAQYASIQIIRDDVPMTIEVKLR